MASLKEVKQRIQSVQSTQQITKAMKMVAAAKLRRAQDKIDALRPYASKLDGILKNVSANVGNVKSEYTEVRDAEKVLIIGITSDRGLCGAFNSNIIKRVTNLLNTDYKAQNDAGNVTLMCLGKKVKDHFARRHDKVITDYFEIFTGLSFDNARKPIEWAMDEFVQGNFDKVVVVYNEFKNVAMQVVQTEQLLPMQSDEAKGEESTSAVDYIFEPSEEMIVKELLPKSIKLQLYKALLDSNASEHGARMTAMDKATENAGELLGELKLTYNRTRQAAITSEILEIVGGAEALKQASS